MEVSRERSLLFLQILIQTNAAQALPNCDALEPFKKVTEYQVRIDFYDLGSEKSLCADTLLIPAYDIRNREEEAYYCLKPQISQVLKCLYNEKEVSVVPSVHWRQSKSNAFFSYHFHTYIKNGANSHSDLFSRVLTVNPLEELTLDAAHKASTELPAEGYAVRANFSRLPPP